jgi:hypothetical protein
MSPGLNGMNLSNFVVVRDHTDLANRALIQCFDGNRTVLVSITQHALGDYFHRSDLTPRQRDLLIDRNLEVLAPVISDKYERGEFRAHFDPIGRPFAPLVELTLGDLQRAPFRLSDTVIEIDARAGFHCGQPFVSPDVHGSPAFSTAIGVAALPAIGASPVAGGHSAPGNEIHAEPKATIPPDRASQSPTTKRDVRRRATSPKRSSRSVAAGRVFISYTHDSEEHARVVLSLSNRLRSDGIDCVLDQYESSPPEGWPQWMDREIKKAQFVLMVCTEAYYRRVMGEEKPGIGHGIAWEGNLIYNHIYSAGSRNSKFIPIIFDPAHIIYISPLPPKARRDMACLTVTSSSIAG